MLILGVDTSGKNGSIGLVECGDRNSRALDVVPLEGGTFSAQLIPQISELLTRHGLGRSQIHAIAAVSGPGSFTGLRVGLAAVKALAEVWGKPVAAVSMLELIARAGGVQGNVIAALDAGRREIYCAEYAISAVDARLLSQELLTREQFLTRSSGLPVITPQAALGELLHGRNSELVEIVAPKADSAARLGFEKIRAGGTVSADALDANYIRRSDAELKNPAGSFQP
jgi:tRNA threonylcarbamoyladenosine biosynthesis protein TsaB